MTDEQLQRIHDIEYSCDSREELAERIVALEDELAELEKLTAGIELPEYPITQFHPKDLERENAKLRKLADAVKEFVEDTHCEDCPCRRDCDDNNVFFCVDDLSYHAFAAMRELVMGLDE